MFVLFVRVYSITVADNTVYIIILLYIFVRTVKCKKNNNVVIFRVYIHTYIQRVVSKYIREENVKISLGMILPIFL